MDQFSRLCALAQRGLQQHSMEDLVLPATASLDEWDTLLKLADKHNVAPLISNALLSCPSELPDTVKDRCRKTLATTAYRNQHLLTQLEQLETLFATHNIPLRSFKGPRFTERYYGDICLRASVDLDVLVQHNSLPEAKRLLLELGFELHSTGPENWLSHTLSPPYEKDFRREKPPLVVEIHWELGATCYHAVEASDIWAHDESEFANEQYLLYYCSHGLGHRWNQLGHVCNVATILLTAKDQIDWDQIKQDVRKHRKQRMFLLSLSLAQSLLNAPIPKDIAQNIATDSKVQRLHEKAVRFMTSNQPPSQSEIFCFKFSAMHTADKVRFMMRTLAQL